MNRHTFPAAPTEQHVSSRAVTTAASGARLPTSTSDFIRRAQAIFNPPPLPTRVNERAAVSNDYMEAMWLAGTDELKIHRARSDYAAALKVIDAKYARRVA